MLKILKKQKIKNLILFMIISAIISVILLGMLGLSDLKKINKNVSEMYNDGVLPIADIAEIRADFIEIRLYAVKNLLHYSEANHKKIQELDKETQEYFLETEKLHLSDKEKELLHEIEKHYKKYMTGWYEVDDMLKDGRSGYNGKVEEITEYGEILLEELENLEAEAVNMAYELEVHSEEVYKESFREFVIILIAALGLLVFVSFLIILIIKTSIKELKQKLVLISKGDLTVNLDTDSKNEFGDMQKELSETVKNISGIINSIRGNSQTINEESQNLASVSEEMTSSAENVSKAVQETARGTGSQAEDLVDIASVMNEFGDTLENIADEVKVVGENSKEVTIMANGSNKDMETLVDSIHEINISFKDVSNKISGLSSSINKINEITNLIDSIAEQTNLLALNAAIEAARAGEAGKGFAVVADEIRKLAEQSKISAQDINELIINISNETNAVTVTSETVSSSLNSQMDIINKSIDSFKQIILAISDITPKIEGINSSVDSLNNNKNDMISKVEEASAVAEEVSATAEEIAASSEEMSASSDEVANTAGKLSNMTKNMIEEINIFKI